MRAFDELVTEAQSADVTGWGFDWLDGRATEERPPWTYSTLLARRLSTATAALDIDTGGGEVIDEAPVLPPRMAATESHRPNIAVARHRLGPRGVDVVEADPRRLPFANGSFDLVTSRHPVSPAWSEIARVFVPGGTYLAPHVGPASAFELIEFFLGPLPENRRSRHPQTEIRRRRGGRTHGRNAAHSTLPHGVLRRRRDRLDPAQVPVVGTRFHSRRLPATAARTQLADAQGRALRRAFDKAPHHRVNALRHLLTSKRRAARRRQLTEQKRPPGTGPALHRHQWRGRLRTLRAAARTSPRAPNRPKRERDRRLRR